MSIHERHIDAVHRRHVVSTGRAETRVPTVSWDECYVERSDRLHNSLVRLLRRVVVVSTRIRVLLELSDT